ncbi:MAG: LiaF domain-containing protein, partial [Actinomycetota bacterium]
TAPETAPPETPTEPSETPTPSAGTPDSETAPPTPSPPQTAASGSPAAEDGPPEEPEPLEVVPPLPDPLPGSPAGQARADRPSGSPTTPDLTQPLDRGALDPPDGPADADEESPPIVPGAEAVTEAFLEQDIRELEAELAAADLTSLTGQASAVQDDLTRGHWALTRTEHETSLAEPEPYDPGPPLASLTLAALALLTGIGLVFNTLIGETVKAATLAGAGTAIVGIAVAISAYTGRTLRLIPIAIGSLVVLMLSPFLDFAIADGVGSSEIRASSTETLDNYYGLGLGYLELRLDDLVITEDTRIQVHVGIGEMEIYVPPDTDVILEGSTQAGYIYLLDSERAGLNQRFTRIPRTEAGDGENPRLIIEAETVIGALSIYRAPGG